MDIWLDLDRSRQYLAGSLRISILTTLAGSTFEKEREAMNGEILEGRSIEYVGIDFSYQDLPVSVP